MAKIFVSSTYFDLKYYRQRVSHAIRRLGHDDVSLEYYVAEDHRPPVKRSLEDIAASDLFIGILAWRYGWIPEEGNPERFSLTELEYNWAHARGKPCLMFLLADDAPWPRKLMDLEAASIEQFRKRVLTERVVSFFTNPDELQTWVVEAVSNWERKHGADARPNPEGASRRGGEGLILPPPPDELIRSCVDNECVAYVGSGFSAELKLPTWSLFISGLLKWAKDMEYVPKDFADSLKEAIETGETDVVADSLVNAIGPEVEALHDYLAATFESAPHPLPERHKLLREIPFSAALTTNFDNLLERTFFNQGAVVRVYTHENTEELLTTLSTRAFFILKLYGTLVQPDSVLIAPAQYRAAVAENLLFSQFIESLFYSRTLLFLGASLDGISAYLSGLKFRGANKPRQHYALVDVSGSAWKVKADLLQRRYGIEVLPYTASEGYPEVNSFLKQVIARVSAAKEKKGRGAPGEKKERRPSSWLQRLRLENVGPFDDQTFEFNRGWNVLFGDNGVGKSSVLKAIAVGICGQEARPYARQLIKVGRPKATITFDIASETDGKVLTRTYITNLLRAGVGAEVESIPTRALEAENLLSLGFPPLRAAGGNKITDSHVGEMERPDAVDLLPLLTGEPDVRLDKLKNWIIERDHIGKSDVSEEVKSRTKRLIEDFFEVIRELTPGVDLELSEIDVPRKRVMVKTPDGVIPIDYVSQGTSSLISWIGVLLRRLFEMYSDQDEPRKQYALVLVDELDAHMHPQWQQQLPRRLRHLFPSAQVIATTHSPLLVPSLEPGEIFALRRDPLSHRVLVEKPTADFSGYRADQILTSPIFRLLTSRDPELYKNIMAYAELAFRKDLDGEGRGRLEELAEKIGEHMPSHEEREEAQRAYDLIKDAVTKEIEKMDFDARGKILNEVKAQLLELTLD